MGKLTKEHHGEGLLRSVASELPSDPEAKGRVWSEDSGAWGLFGDMASDEDELIIWCCSAVGDRIHLNIMEAEDDREVGMIIDLERRTSHRGPRWSMKIMRNNGTTFRVEADETRLFKAARRLALGS